MNNVISNSLQPQTIEGFQYLTLTEINGKEDCDFQVIYIPTLKLQIVEDGSASITDNPLITKLGIQIMEQYINAVYPNNPDYEHLNQLRDEANEWTRIKKEFRYTVITNIHNLVVEGKKAKEEEEEEIHITNKRNFLIKTIAKRLFID